MLYVFYQLKINFALKILLKSCIPCCRLVVIHVYEPPHGKTNNMVSERVLTQIRLYNQRSRLETGNFGYRKWRNCTIRVAKTKALISFAVTAKLICTFDFPKADCWFSHVAAHIMLMYRIMLFYFRTFCE